MREALAPALSILTPAYNAATRIGRTLDSVLAQGYRDWELLVVDDCSSDATREVVAAYAAREPRIRLVVQARNGGPARARQAAVERAQGRYIAFLDSDDCWLPGKLERQLAFMRRTGAAFSHTAFRRVTVDGARVGRLIGVPARLTYGQLLGNTAIATSTAIVDRAATGPFRMTDTYYDDFALWLEITRRGFPAFGLNEDLMRYCVTGGSVSRNKLRSARMVWRLYREVEKLGMGGASWSFARYAVNALWKYRSF
jgi:teichuronic acid biosynthesis glycosyltransferase TuaG